MKDKLILKQYDLAEYLGVSLTHARELMHMDGFPTYVIGQTLYTTKPAVDKWLLLEDRRPQGDTINPAELIKLSKLREAR